MSFKLGKAKRIMITPNNHIPVYKRNLDKGILGEAYKDGSIAVDTSVKEGSQQYKDVVAHEMDHAKRMKTGELDYGTDFVRWRGKTYPRKDGKIKYDGKWMIEGHRNFPWEKIADKAFRKKVTLHDLNSRAFGLTMQRVGEETKVGSPSPAAAMAKYYGTEHNKLRYELMLEAMGTSALGWEGEGFSMEELAITRDWLRTKANSIEGGTSEVQLNVISKRVLGLPDK